VVDGVVWDGVWAAAGHAASVASATATPGRAIAYFIRSDPQGMLPFRQLTSHSGG
jgi:hypothetical protein